MDRNLIKRVVSNVIDFDMHNLFPPRTPQEEEMDAAGGTVEVMPRRTLRERSYGLMPLMLKPKYEGDFLKKLREKMKNKSAANPLNIYDYSMPSEMLKHMESPMPDDRTHGFIERHRPGDGAGMTTLQDYYDRGWDPTDSPEMSEDKWLRMKTPPKGRPWSPPVNKPWKPPKDILSPAKKVAMGFLAKQGAYETSPDPSNVVVSHLLRIFPVSVPFPVTGISKTAAVTIEDLNGSQYYSQKVHNYRDLDTSGVTAHMITADPRRGMWTFKVQPQTPTGNPKKLPEPYTVVFQAIPSGNVRDVNKLEVRCACTCPSWLWYGAQFNAYMNDYLYGHIRPKFLPPRVRDPQRKFLCCKHVMACLPLMEGKQIEIPKSMRERVKRRITPKTKVLKPTEPEAIKIPDHLKKFDDDPKTQELVDQWDKKSAVGRRKAIFKMDDPDEIAYMAHKFPDTATAYVAEKLREIMRTTKDKKEAAEAEENLEEIV